MSDGLFDSHRGYAIKAKSEADFEGSLDYWRDLAKMLKAVVKEDEQTIDRLQKQNDCMREALGYYAEPTNWESTGKGLAIMWVDKIHEDSEQCTEQYRTFHGGLRARQALKDCEGM